MQRQRPNYGNCFFIHIAFLTLLLGIRLSILSNMSDYSAATLNATNSSAESSAGALAGILSSNNATAALFASTGLFLASQAVNVASVKTHVPICLDLKTFNYSMWCTFVIVLLGKYKLLNHFDFSPPHADVIWGRKDFIVHSWLYASILEEILSIIMEPE